MALLSKNNNVSSAMLCGRSITMSLAMLMFIPDLSDAMKRPGPYNGRYWPRGRSRRTRRRLTDCSCELVFKCCKNCEPQSDEGERTENLDSKLISEYSFLNEHVDALVEKYQATDGMTTYMKNKKAYDKYIATPKVQECINVVEKQTECLKSYRKFTRTLDALKACDEYKRMSGYLSEELEFENIVKREIQDLKEEEEIEKVLQTKLDFMNQRGLKYWWLKYILQGYSLDQVDDIKFKMDHSNPQEYKDKIIDVIIKVLKRCRVKSKNNYYGIIVNTHNTKTKGKHTETEEYKAQVEMQHRYKHLSAVFSYWKDDTGRKRKTLSRANEQQSERAIKELLLAIQFFQQGNVHRMIVDYREKLRAKAAGIKKNWRYKLDSRSRPGMNRFCDEELTWVLQMFGHSENECSVCDDE